MRFDVSFTLTIADDVADAPELLTGLVEQAMVDLLDDAIDEDQTAVEAGENWWRCGVHFSDAVDFKVKPLEEYVVEPLPPKPVDVACPACKKKDGEANHPPGMVFVGMGHGWQPCSACSGTGVKGGTQRVG
jgi:hypothetical protein